MADHAHTHSKKLTLNFLFSYFEANMASEVRTFMFVNFYQKIKFWKFFAQNVFESNEKITAHCFFLKLFVNFHKKNPKNLILEFFE